MPRVISFIVLLAIILLVGAIFFQVMAQFITPRGDDGNGDVSITGDNRQWHKLTLTLNGPFARERDNSPNPFLDYRMTVKFAHESGEPDYVVPGYFAADGNAANSSAQAGNQWRAHLSPDKAGEWSYQISFERGKRTAIDGDASAEPVAPFDGGEGKFTIAATDKKFPDFRSRGRLQYVGEHYLRFSGSGEYFLKAGADSPETMLGYADFDDTVAGKKNVPLKTWQAHVSDWREGDTTWQDGKGKGLIGALNYLASKGCNAFSFLPYNAGGDGDNVWPFVERDDKLHYDCSKLDQWGIVFDHATAKGLYLHFKMQETEIDDNRGEHEQSAGGKLESLDGGQLGPERKLYCRELIARFAHALALNWNIGEENTQSTTEVRDMVQYIHDNDPYHHHIVIHTYPDQQDNIYTPLLGDGSLLTGASLQNSWNEAHQKTKHWVRMSNREGRPWVIANDEQGSADLGVPPDPGYQGFGGYAGEGEQRYNLDDIRKFTLWGNLLAGGAGVEYYFGYQLPQNDLQCEDFRSRDRSWGYCRTALNFFRENKVPFWQMKNADGLVGNGEGGNSKYCFAKSGDIYLVYLPRGGTSDLDLNDVAGDFVIKWFDPRGGGKLVDGSVQSVTGGGKVALGLPPSDPDEDWLIVCRK